MTLGLELVTTLLKRVTVSCFGTQFTFRVEQDNPAYGRRIFLQVCYLAPCTKTGEVKEWRGRKWYLSEYMTKDEVIKTAYVAFESCVKHEIMEGFKVDGIILFNPHVNFEELLAVSNREVTRN